MSENQTLFRRSIFRRISFLLALALTLAAFPTAASAHPLDEANVYHFFTCALTPKTLHIEYKLLVGGLSMFKTWDSIDTDHNKVISPAEKQAFTERLRGALTVTLDDKPLVLTLDSVDIPSYDDFIGGSAPFITFQYTVTWDALTPGDHTLTLATSAFSDLTNVYLPATINAPRVWKATATTDTGQKGSTVRFTRPAPVVAVHKSLLPKPSQTAATHLAPEANVSALPTENPMTSVRIPRPRGRLAEGPKAGYVLCPAPQADRPMESLMEAAIIASARAAQKLQNAPPPLPPREKARRNGTERPEGQQESQTLPPLPPRENEGEAARSLPRPPPPSKVLRALRPFLLGRGGVLVALGLAALLGMGHALLPGHSKAVVGAYLVGSRGTVGDAVFLGGVVTFAHTGAVLLFGVLMWKMERFAPERIQPWLQVGSGLLIAALGFGLFLRGLLRWYGVGERWEDAEENAQEGAFAYAPRPSAAGRRRGKRSLLALGLAGGMVPCGDALILLLFAHAQGRTGFGLVLVTAFGLGMAATLMGIGILLVKARGLASRLRLGSEGRVLRALPIVSAAMVLVLGLWLACDALIASRLILVNF